MTENYSKQKTQGQSNLNSQKTKFTLFMLGTVCKKKMDPAERSKKRQITEMEKENHDEKTKRAKMDKKKQREEWQRQSNRKKKNWQREEKETEQEEHSLLVQRWQTQ